MNNILSDKLNMSGNGFKTASEAFHRIEDATASAAVDLSIVSVLSYLGKTGRIAQAVLLDGNDELVIRNGSVCLKDATYVNIKLNETNNQSMEGSLFFQAGGVYKTPINANDPDFYAVGAAAFKSLSKHLKIEHKSNRGFFRDADIAARCAGMDKEDTVHLLYRHDGNIKKVFSCFVNSDGLGYLKFNELCDMVHSVSPMASITDWSITQTARSVCFLTEYNQELKVSWSDTGFKAMTAEVNGEITRFRSREALSAYINSTLGMESKVEAFFSMPVSKLLSKNTSCAVTGWKQSHNDVLEITINANMENTAWQETIIDFPGKHKIETRLPAGGCISRSITYGGQNKMVTIMYPSSCQKAN